MLEEEIFQEAATYPPEWDMELFKKLPSFAKRVKYAMERLGKLGQGSARVVFSVDDSTVIKIARNVKGLEQNGVESDVGTKNWHDCAVRVFDSDPENLWIEAEKAQRVKKSDFKKLVGYNFDTWTSVLFYKIMNLKNGTAYYILNEPLAKEIMEGEFFNDIVEMAGNWDMNPGDFKRINSWGLVNRNGAQQLVLIDLGLTEQIYKDFYYSGPKF